MKLFKIDNIFIFLYKILLAIIGSIIVYIMFKSSSSGYFSWYIKSPLNFVILLIGCIAHLGLLVLLSYTIKFLSEKTLTILSIMLLSLIFVALIVGGSIFRIEYSYDIKYLHTTAYEFVMGKGEEISTLWYLNRYPHQWNASIVLSVFYAIGNFFSLESNLIYVASYLLVWFAAFFSWLSIRKMLNARYALLFLFAFFLHPIFYMYAAYFYTDNLSMPFIYAMMYIAISGNEILSNNRRIDKKHTNKYKVIRGYLYILLSGVVGSIGFFVRATSGIPAIAILLLLVVYKPNYNNFKKAVSFLLGIGISLLLLTYIGHVTNPGLDKEGAFPAEHWVAMGTDSSFDGRYYMEAEKFTYSFKTHDAKVINNRKRILEHVHANGIKGSGKLILRKMVILWGDGTNDMEAYFNERNYLGSLSEFAIKDKTVLVKYVYQFVRLSLFTAVLIALFFEWKKKELDLQAVLWISFFGLCLFYGFWEVMSRYSITFIPMLIMLQSIGIGRLMKYK